MGNPKVLRFPVERTRVEEKQPLIIAWYRCGGGCGALVTSAGAVCVGCIREHANG